MDLRITKKRVNDHLSYDWWKYIAVLLLCVLLWNLIFTIATPKLHKSKNMHIIFITDNFNSSDGVAYSFIQQNLKKYLNEPLTEFERGGYEEVNIDYPQISASSVEEFTKFNTWLQVSNGDFYAFDFSLDPIKSTFDKYIDNGYFTDLEKLIEDAKQYAASVYADSAAFAADNPKVKESRIEEEFKKDTAIKISSGEAAQKLEGYIQQYPDLFYSYARNENLHDTYQGTGINPDERTVENLKIWGLSLNKLTNSKNSTKNGFLTTVSPGDTELSINVALAVTRFKADNMPFYYYNLWALNFFIETYHIGTAD